MKLEVTDPLDWPPDWPRTIPGDRRHSLSGGDNMGYYDVCDRLHRNLELLGASEILLSRNRAMRGRPSPDPGVAVYFKLKKMDLTMAQDAYRLQNDNIRSLALAIEGMRQMDRHGGGAMTEKAFTGFQQLEGPQYARPWYDILGVPETAPVDAIRAGYRKAAAVCHPDKGGDQEGMMAVNKAYDEALALRGASR